MHRCRLCRVFEEGNPAAVVTSGLMTVSQLVRMSRENYRPLGEANVYGTVRRLLGHRDAQVRARACNLVGNMCRWGHLPQVACTPACHLRPGVQLRQVNIPAGLPATPSSCHACKHLSVNEASVLCGSTPQHLATTSLLLCPCPSSQDSGAAGTSNVLAAALCRHSAHFYSALERSGLLEPLIVLCRDEDRATRKFACFAIGNAGEPSALCGLGMLQRATRWQRFQGQLASWDTMCHAGTAWPQAPRRRLPMCLHFPHCIHFSMSLCACRLPQCVPLQTAAGQHPAPGDPAV